MGAKLTLISFQHIVFLHKNGIAHLDISIRNLLTDYRRPAYIDYELSRRFGPVLEPLVYNYRGTEVPPECDGDDGVNPFKVDVWALGVLILRACQVSPSGFIVVYSNSILSVNRSSYPRAYTARQVHAER